MSDKTEQATTTRKRKARADGDVAISRVLLGGAGTAVSVLAVQVFGLSFVAAWRRYFISASLSSYMQQANTETVFAVQMVQALASEWLAVVGLIGCSACLSIILVGLLQTQGTASTKRLAKMPKLRSVTSLFAELSLPHLARLCGTLFCLLAIVNNELGPLLLANQMQHERVPTIVSRAGRMMTRGVEILLISGLVEYLAIRRKHANRLKMSKSEVRQEMRDVDGRPEIRARVRAIQRRRVRRSVSRDIAAASVLIVNPVHYAVGLLFDRETMDPPTVIAKGQGLVAAEFRKCATYAGVPIVENAPLARSLYRGAEEGEAIPFHLFAAVAAVLAYVLAGEQNARGYVPRNIMRREL